jgi:hypothetical protein
MNENVITMNFVTSLSNTVISKDRFDLRTFITVISSLRSNGKQRARRG